jgi:hypothetical protein
VAPAVVIVNERLGTAVTTSADVVALIAVAGITVALALVVPQAQPLTRLWRA